MSPRRAKRSAGRRVVWTARALADVEQIGEYIALDSAVESRRWVDALIAKAESVAPLPFVGRRVPEFTRDEVREVLLGAYRIVYRVLDDRVEIATVFEGHRLMLIAEPEKS